MVKWFVCTVSLAVAAWMIEGITIQNGWTLLFAALVVGFLNAFIRPIIILLTLPLNILTLGFFTFIINAAMILFTAKIVGGFTVEGFFAALLAAIVMSIVSFLLNIFIPGS
ncbi:MAG TPA: phage holin family protein [Deltaproteobacteria bacterium]|nr:phage holin family protein [Deltaproteobacteria bacterium]